MTDAFTELASVDGRISPTAEAVVPMRDDGLYRGDGAFEVIRLYAGRPFALGDHLDRLERSAAAIELEFDRAALEREVDALLAEHGSGDGQLRLIVTRGGRRIAATEPLPPHAETLRLAVVTYCPSVILNGVKSLSYAANMQATRIAKGTGRRRGGAGHGRTEPCSSRRPPRSSGSARRARCAPRRSTTASSSRSPATDWSRPCTSRRAPGRSPTCAPRSEAFLASTTREIQAVSAIDGTELPDAPGPRTREAMEAFAATLGQELNLNTTEQE